MRVLIALLLTVVPGVALAQRGAEPRSSDSGGSTLPPIGLPLPEIGMPLVSSGLRLPPLGLAPLPAPTQRPVAPAGGRVRKPGSPEQRHGRRGPSVVYVLPAYPWSWWDEGSAAPAGPPVEEPVPTGTVWFDIEPRGVGEVYIDGYLAGTTMDVRGSIPLDAGTHRIEVLAEGYEPVVVDVRLDAGAVVTLRRALKPLASAPPPGATAPPGTSAPAASIPRKPFYFIPGCYMGDVPPTEARLPASCDLSKATVIKP